MEESMVEANPTVVMTLATKTEINGNLQRMGAVLSFSEISLCSHTANFHNAQKQNPTTFCYLTLIPT